MITRTPWTDANVYLPFGAVNEIPEGRPVAKTLGGHTIMVVKLLGKCHAVDNRCTHAGGSLCDGNLNGQIITCPLHFAKFDVTTGEVKGPPATVPLKKYATRVVDGVLEVEVETTSSPLPLSKGESEGVDPFKKWRLPFLLLIAAFWVIEILAQRALQPRADLPYHLLVASAFTGATLISTALFLSAIFMWRPRLGDWWRIRRYFGVSGVVFASIHVLLVWATVLKWDLSSYLFSFNPIENPVLFGSLALPIFLIMAFTSTDWAVDKLTFKRWKIIHRFVYLAFPLLILHYVGMKPDLLSSWPGILLGLMSTLALLGQLYWFVRTTLQRGFKISTVVGLVLIVGFALVAYFALSAWR